MIIMSIAVLGGISATLAICIAIALNKFKVETDPRFEGVRAVLPGANCGACGCVGCDDFAQALLDAKARPENCPVGGQSLVKQLLDLLGGHETHVRRMVAHVRCLGDSEKSVPNYEYQGMDSCWGAAVLAAEGSKSCTYGCLGSGSCKVSCKFNAIKIINHIAVIDDSHCVGCGFCIVVCPKGLIEMVPFESKIRVGCNAKDDGKTTKQHCSIGCIGCKICTRNCEPAAAHMDGHLARIHYDKCNMCGACMKKCPAKCIVEHI